MDAARKYMTLALEKMNERRALVAMARARVSGVMSVAGATAAEMAEARAALEAALFRLESATEEVAFWSDRLLSIVGEGVAS
jgi:hypothetical protein